MPFKIVRNDLTKMHVDAIVNTANPRPMIGSGTDIAIYNAAGVEALLEERKKIGVIERGDARITPAFRLPARYIIHTVGPRWKGGNQGEERILRACYVNSLHLAKENHCESIAFPLISTGNYGFPKDKALKTVISVISDFLLNEEMMIYLVVFDEKSTKLSEHLFDRIEAHIDQEYVNSITKEEYKKEGLLSQLKDRFRRKRKDEASENASPIRPGGYREGIYEDAFPTSSTLRDELLDANYSYARREESIENDYPSFPTSKPKLSSKPVTSKRKLSDLMKDSDETFQQMLLRMIAEKGMTNAQAYKKANQDKKLFSKIKNDVNYQPKKKTAMAFALALELNMDQTKDLLARAGYAFSPCSKFDKAIQYFIENQNYNIYEIEIVLYDLGLENLCNYG